MIQNGDFFTVNDLKDSVHQVERAGGAHIKYVGMTPQQYADENVRLYEDVKSSAAALDKSVRDAGFRTTYKFSYDYRIPGLLHDEIVRDAYKLEYFYKIMCSMIQRGAPINFSGVFDDAARVSYYYAQYIWAANPSTRFDYAEKLDMYMDWGRVLSFLLGVGFRFHPCDVYEFVMNFNNPGLNEAGLKAERQKQQVFKDWCAKHNVDTGCLVLSAAHQDKLRKIINKTDTPYVLQLVMAPFKKR